MPVFLVALAAACVLQGYTVMRSQSNHFNLGTYSIEPGRMEQKVYGPMTFTASSSLNEFEAQASLDNDWVELDGALVNAQTGKAVGFTNAFSYYSGRDSDGSWSEGSRRDTSLITEVPAGTYNLIVEGAAGNANGRPTLVHLALNHDVAPWRNFWLALLAIAAYPAVLIWQRRRFEADRWAESDYGPVSDDDDD
jgi:hypothetical protein